MKILFWADIFLIFYTLAGYPLLLFLLNKFIKKDNHEIYPEQMETLPIVSVVVAAFNEEKVIREKIENTLNNGYPRESLELIIGSDASTDSTESIVREYSENGVILKTFPLRKGKINVLNRCIPEAKGRFIILTDANIMLARDSMSKIIQGFTNPRVGAICGNQKLLVHDQSTLEGGESTYWEYDKALKMLEMGLGSIVSADGSFYAIRKELFDPIPEGVMDDLFISLEIIRKGYKILFDKNAIAFEDAITRSSMEFKRRVRIVQMSLMGLWLERSLVNPFHYGIYSFELFSHKILRRLLPAFILLLFPLNLWIVNQSEIYTFIFAFQLSFYGVAFAAFIAETANLSPGKLKVPYYFVVGMIGTLVGLLYFLKGHERREWEKSRPE